MQKKLNILMIEKQKLISIEMNARDSMIKIMFQHEMKVIGND